MLSAPPDMPKDPNETFRTQVTRPEEQLDLLRCTLLIASDEYPDLDIEAYVRRLDEWASQLKRLIPPQAGHEAIVRRLNHFLFNQLGFTGNTEDFYDPRNSYLNEVLDRRRGIPISLSVVYLELGRRLGLPLQGVSFPGHFLVKFAHQGGEVVLDPFNHGISLSEEDLHRRLQEIFDEDVEQLSPFLVPAGNRDILVRMLSNLKAIYQNQGEGEQALKVVNKILIVNPALTDQYRDRGLLLNSLECYHAALKDLQSYLKAKPEAEDVEPIRKLVIGLQEAHSRIN